MDVPQLVENLGPLRENWLKADTERNTVACLVENLIHLIATVSPGAKLGSTAPFAYADLVMVEAGERQPRTLANAFFNPIGLRSPDILGEAMTRLSDYIVGTDAMYGCGESRWLACRTGQAVAGLKPMPLAALAGAVKEAIIGAGAES